MDKQTDRQSKLRNVFIWQELRSTGTPKRKIYLFTYLLHRAEFWRRYLVFS
jgi:hypothetical protein